jgi:ABC-type nickel/cobalt efflux system permease component RcnA
VTARGRRAAASAWLAILLLTASTAAGHPLGNFTISHYAGLDLESDALRIRYVIDMAEIPTFQEMQSGGLVAERAHPSVAPWVARQIDVLRRGLRVSLDGRPLELTATSSEILFPPGEGELPTLKLGVVYRADLGAAAAGPAELRYADTNYPDRAGWKEVVVRGGAGVTILASTAPATDRSAQLSDYPTDLLDSPPQDLEARVTFTRAIATAAAPPAPSAGAPPAAPAPALDLQPNRQAAPGSALAGLLSERESGAGIFAMALLVAAVLGAFHALEPGHGKTVVAAYLVGSRGTVRHALILGLVVTASHTAGVYLLGALTFYASRHIVPERLFPWLSLLSGLTIAVLGAVLFLRRYTGADDGHHHHHHHGHHHGDEVHDHHHGDGRHDHTHEPVSLRALFALGVSGGIIPCPAALVVLLGALSVRRVGFGLILIVAFSVGLAAVLVVIGILMVYARRLMARFREEGPLINRWLPLTSSAVMTLLGLGIAAQALTPWMPR